MSAEKFFQLPDGRWASLYRLRLPDGFGADITDFGGCLCSLYAFDRFGKLRDVALGWQEPAVYLENPGYLGALIGRIPNRITGGRFTLDGKIYQMCLNDQDCCTLHGGFGYSHRLWQAEQPDERHLVLTLFSPDGDGGFPGALTVRASYTLGADHTLELDFYAESDRKTVADLTSHAYFNLEGENSGRCDTHHVTLHADRVTAVDEHLLPTGETPDVTGTRFDLRCGKSFRTIFSETPGGFDDNFIIADRDGLHQECVAQVCAENSGIRMTVHTSRPGIQFYMGSFLPGCEYPGKSGTVYGRNSGFCLETQCWPDAVNHPDFPSVVITPERPFHGVTRLQFDHLK